MWVYITGIAIVIRDHLGIPLYAKAPCFLGVFCPVMGPIIRLSEESAENRDLKERKGVKVYGSWGG